MSTLRSERESDNINHDNRMRLARGEFRAEVDNMLKPIRSELNSQSDTLGQIRTMVSSLVHRTPVG